MEAVRISETSLNFNVTTWRYIPEDSKLNILGLLTRLMDFEGCRMFFIDLALLFFLSLIYDLVKFFVLFLCVSCSNVARI
jgi:hypothetical protein